MGARNEVHTDLLVVGSGIAGLTAALRASRTADVLLVTKTELGEGSTRYAQGGIAGALDPADSAAAHARDTLGAGAGLCDEAAVRVLCEEGPTAIRRLIDLGVAFDRTGGPDSSYAMCLEGAHSRPRILHAGGDATGRAIENALVAAVRERGDRSARAVGTGGSAGRGRPGGRRRADDGRRDPMHGAGASDAAGDRRRRPALLPHHEPCCLHGRRDRRRRTGRGRARGPGVLSVPPHGARRSRLLPDLRGGARGGRGGAR